MTCEKMLVKKMQIDAKKNGEMYNIFRNFDLLNPPYGRCTPRNVERDLLQKKIENFLEERDKQKNGEIRLFNDQYFWRSLDYLTIDKFDKFGGQAVVKLNTPMFRLSIHLTESEQYFQSVSKYLVDNAFDETYRLVKNEKSSDCYDSTIKNFLSVLNPESYLRLIHSLGGGHLNFLINYLENVGKWDGMADLRKLVSVLEKNDVAKICDYLSVEKIFWRNYYKSSFDTVSALMNSHCTVGKQIAAQVCKSLKITL